MKHTASPVLAFLVHVGAVQILLAPCLVHANPPAMTAVVQFKSAQIPCLPPCLWQWPPFFCAFDVQPSILHFPLAPCFSHKPLAYALVAQPSIKQGPAPCVVHSPLALDWLVQSSTEHIFTRCYMYRLMFSNKMVGEGEIILGFAHMLQHSQHLRVPLAWWNTGILIEWTTRATPN